MATKKSAGKKTGAEKPKQASRRVSTKDLDTKKNPKGGPIGMSWLPG